MGRTSAEASSQRRLTRILGGDQATARVYRDDCLNHEQGSHLPAQGQGPARSGSRRTSEGDHRRRRSPEFLPAACRIRSEAFVAMVRGGRRETVGTRGDDMTQYLISFDEGAMDHIRDEDLPEVAEAGHAVVQEAKEAGVFVFSGGWTTTRSTPL
jgi:hypothetical protein